MSIVSEPEFADRLLDAAESVFAFARMDRGLYTDCLNGTGAFYRFILHIINTVNPFFCYRHRLNEPYGAV